jgi:hypothetical protein
LLHVCAPVRAPPAKTAASSPFDVFSVAVGSSAYIQSKAAHLHAFGDLPEAAKSARAIASLLHPSGARFGLTLLAGEKYVSVADVEKAIEDVHGAVLNSKTAHPIVLFYFAGHGISEGIAWNHFSVPGTLLLDDTYDRMDAAELEKHTLYAGSLVDKLEGFKISFLVILDTCYEGDERSFGSAVLSKTASQNLGAVAAALRVMNEFRDTYPVLFSTSPGSVVSTVADSLQPDSLSVTPFARRMIIFFNQTLKQHSTMSLLAFVSAMTSKDLDSTTSPAVTRATLRRIGTRLFSTRVARARQKNEPYCDAARCLLRESSGCALTLKRISVLASSIVAASQVAIA